MVSQACGQLKKFEEQNIRLPIAINISPLQLADDDSFIATLQENLSQLKDPALLEIELTESYVDKNKQDRIAEKLCEIKKLQVKVTIDDFGSGAASLKTLLYYKVDAIKLDQSLIINLVADPKAQKLVKMAIEFGHDPDINAKIIAERVETKEQLELLKNLGCDEVQGYLFSKPQPLTETEKYFLQQVNNKK